MVVLSAAIIKKDKTLVARGSDMFSQHPLLEALYIILQFPETHTHTHTKKHQPLGTCLRPGLKSFTDAKHDQNVRIRGSVSFFDPCPIVL